MLTPFNNYNVQTNLFPTTPTPQCIQSGLDLCSHRVVDYSSGRNCVGNRLKHRHGRSVERSEYADYIEVNAQRVKENKAYCRKRQAIVEPVCPAAPGRHPFGTIKRQWGFNYTLLNGLQKVDGEFGLVFFSYNLKRLISILVVRTLVNLLK